MKQVGYLRVAFGMLLSLGVCVSALAQNAGLSALSTYLKSTKQGSANFVQTITAPNIKSKQSSGTFTFVRPSKFRFDYQKPFAQLIVADGKTLWMYDKDLNQVTASAQKKVLASTPAAILATASSLADLQKSFTLSEVPASEGLIWVQALPIVAKPAKGDVADGSPFKQIRIGFRNGVLGRIDILDNFGRNSSIVFSDVKSNAQAKIAAGSFVFKPPAGADLIK